MLNLGNRFEDDKVDISVAKKEALAQLIKPQIAFLKYDRNSVLRDLRIKGDSQSKLKMTSAILIPERLFGFLLLCTKSLKKGGVKKLLVLVLEEIIPYFDFFKYCPYEVALALDKLGKSLERIARPNLRLPARRGNASHTEAARHPGDPRDQNRRALPREGQGRL